MTGGLPVVLRSRRLLLRPAAQADVLRRLEIGSLPAEILRAYGFAAPDGATLSEAEAEAWVHGLMQHPYAWVIEAEGWLLGEVRLDRVDHHDRRASLAIGLLEPRHLGKGYGTEAASEILRFAFGPLALHRVGVRVLAFNERAIRFYRGLGFVEEGREREAARVDGVWHDDLIMGLLSHEFSPGRARPAGTR